jgi:hypothetical protein
LEGVFLYTLTLTDVATTWTECLPLLHRSQHGVVQALQRARGLFPFPLRGIDTDNGGEFINDELMAYCATEQLTFTRGRVVNKTDQCYVGVVKLTGRSTTLVGKTALYHTTACRRGGSLRPGHNSRSTRFRAFHRATSGARAGERSAAQVGEPPFASS